MVLINVSGSVVKDYTYDMIRQKIESKMDLIENFANKTSEIKLNIQPMRAGQYEITMSLISPRRPIHMKKEGHNIFFIIDDILKDMEKLLKKRAGK